MSFIYIYGVVISVYLLLFPVITQEPLDRFASNFDCEIFDCVDFNSENLVSWQNRSSAGKRQETLLVTWARLGSQASLG